MQSSIEATPLNVVDLEELARMIQTIIAQTRRAPAAASSSPSNSAWHPDGPTVPEPSQTSESTPRWRSMFDSALQVIEDTKQLVALLAITISLRLDNSYDNIFFRLILALVLLVTTVCVKRSAKTVIRIRMVGEKVIAAPLLFIYIACGLGLLIISLFTPFSLISSCLKLRPRIEPLDLLHVLHAAIVVYNFIQLSSKLILCTVLSLTFRINQMLNIALALEAATDFYVLLSCSACWLTYLMKVDSLVLKFAVVTLYLLVVVIRLLTGRQYYQALLVWFKRRNTFGSSASHAIAEEAGGICTVCLESYKQPIKLHVCSHVFCEECIMLWLLGQSTCPLCRKPVISNH